MDHPLVALIEALRAYRLLEPEQLGELTPGLLTRYAGPDALVEDLVRRDWLTPYQVQQIRDGHGKDLVLEPYLLLRPLGRGGMGQVFLARHRCMHRVVALKVIRQRSRADRPVGAAVPAGDPGGRPPLASQHRHGLRRQ